MLEDQETLINDLLGPLERKVMNIIWEGSDLSVQDVVEQLNENQDDQKEYAYTTIMTVMSRLVEKGVLKKEKSGRKYLYQAVFQKDEYIKHKSDQAVKGLLNRFGDVAISRFVDTVGSDPEQLNKLKQFIEQLDRGEHKK
ncbi:BlaI/MecI/CopY family transcriptional regulator [Sporosarcina soli]|uniref:BlaI/MecI/CopY family transcriptional regulator n=1 Tax=Sporosarcina soli TaxID=334736 RepID=A0ABW0TQ42_9BACL